jgi:hypothetical protein
MIVPERGHRADPVAPQEFGQAQHRLRPPPHGAAAASALDAFVIEEDRIVANARRMQAEPEFCSRSFVAYSYQARGRYAEPLQRWFQYCRSIGNPQWSLRAYPAAGRDRHRGDNEKVIGFARDYFGPHDAALYDLLGDRYEWPG